MTNYVQQDDWSYDLTSAPMNDILQVAYGGLVEHATTIGMQREGGTFIGPDGNAVPDVFAWKSLDRPPSYRQV